MTRDLILTVTSARAKSRGHVPIELPSLQFIEDHDTGDEDPSVLPMWTIVLVIETHHDPGATP